MKSVLDPCLEQLGNGLRGFPWAQPRAYADWLAQTYYYVSHSTRLLAASAARFGHDELEDRLHHRFAAHMAEEKRHELLALHDVKMVGFTLEDFPERSSTRMFYEPQYYKIEHQDPIALFGYILALEAMSATHGRWTLEQVLTHHGKSCARFLAVHAHDDEDHLAKAFEVLEKIPPDRQRAIETNLRQSTYAYLMMLADVRQLIV